MSPFQTLISILIFCTISAASRPLVTGSDSCAKKCRIHLCNHLVAGLTEKPNGFTNVLRAPGDPMSGAFCQHKRLLAQVKVGQPLVRLNDTDDFVAISHYRPSGLFPRFKKFFYVTKHYLAGQTLSHEHSLGNQDSYINDLCVKIPVLTFKKSIRTRQGPKLSDPVTGKSQDCVAFRAVSPKLAFEVSWYTEDDFDIVVTEPSDPSAFVSRFHPKTKNGGYLLSDIGAEGFRQCSVRMQPGTKRRECVIYEKGSAAPRGTYKVCIHHLRNCGRGPTKFKVKVLINGKVVLEEQGVSDGGLSSVAAEYTVKV